MPAISDHAQLHPNAINCNPCIPTILALYCPSTASQNHLRTIHSHTGLYVANLQHAKPTKAMPAMPNCIQMQLIIINCNPCNPTILAVYCRSTASQNHLRTIRSHRTGLYVANLQHAKPTKAMPAMPNCIQMQLIATHAFPPFWLYIAHLRRPKTTSEQSVPTLACMLPTYSMPNQLKPCHAQLHPNAINYN